MSPRMTTCAPHSAADAAPDAGAVERALAPLLADALELDSPDGALARLEPCPPRRPGDLRVDLSDRLPRERGAAKRELATWASLLSRHAALHRVVAVPPALYVTPSDAVLADAVLAAVEREGSCYGGGARTTETLLVSSSSPNANKPLHLGHLRNGFLGGALAGLAEHLGHRVVRTAVLSDWGVHICQAALAHERWGKGATPDSAGLPGDALVGDAYVRFHAERARLAAGVEGTTELDGEARAWLQAVERGDPARSAAHDRVVAWAAGGIAETWRRVGARFDAVLRERDALPTARRLLESGLASGACRRRADGSILLDMGDADADEVTLVRADGTAVAYTQLLGAYVIRQEVFRPARTLVLLGQEWKLGLRVITEGLRRFGCAWADTLEPVYYGMVRLPHGRMKSREGTTVEARELLDAVVAELGDAPAEVAEPLAVGLLGAHFLRRRRVDPLDYVEDTVWSATLPRHARLVALASRAEAHTGVENHGRAAEREPDAPVPGGEPAAQGPLDRSARRAERELLLALNAWPRTLRRALARREPALVLRTLDGLVELAGAARPRVRRAVATVARGALGLLGLPLPPADAALPARYADLVHGARREEVDMGP